MGPESVEDPLDRIRTGIAILDLALVRLLARRLRLARRAVRLRLASGGRRTDSGQEAQVRARGRRWARQCGVPERLVDHWLVELMLAAKDFEELPEGRARAKAVPGVRRANPRRPRRA